MSIGEHETHFLGHAIHTPGVKGIAPGQTVFRIAQNTNGLLRWLGDDPLAGTIEGLVIGPYGGYDDSSEYVVERLVALAPKFTALRGVFIGDIIFDELELSWIRQSSMAPLLAAYPTLEVLRVRGGNGLAFGAIDHANLRTLIVESGGLPSTVIEEILGGRMSALEHLELWLGDGEYGWDGSIDLFEPLFERCPFPALTHLALRNAEIADEIAIAIAESPIMGQLKSLDLSLGILTDRGAEALLASENFKALERFDYHHHYVTEPLMARLRALKMAIDDSDANTAEDINGDSCDDFYVAHSE